MYKSIKTKLKAFPVNMGGIVLDQSLPNRQMDQIDPFLLIHHWADHLPGNQDQKTVGVGPHPHRGFAPVTFIFKGGVHHRDSTGYDQVVYEGGTQWMNSGKGIIHSERPPKELAKSGGDFEIIQFWVNAPSKNKMDPADYQSISKDDTPWVKSEDGLIDIGLVAGELNGKKGKIKPYSELLILRLELKAGGQTIIPVPKDFNVLAYQLNGQSVVNDDTAIGTKDLVQFEQDGSSIKIEAKTDGRLILLSGRPIGEPTATYGPFVMNSQTEVLQAMDDYQKGRMGYLVENFD